MSNRSINRRALEKIIADTGDIDVVVTTSTSGRPESDDKADVVDNILTGIIKFLARAESAAAGLVGAFGEHHITFARIAITGFVDTSVMGLTAFVELVTSLVAGGAFVLEPAVFAVTGFGVDEVQVVRVAATFAVAAGGLLACRAR